MVSKRVLALGCVIVGFVVLATTPLSPAILFEKGASKYEQRNVIENLEPVNDNAGIEGNHDNENNKFDFDSTNAKAMVPKTPKVGSEVEVEVEVDVASASQSNVPSHEYGTVWGFRSMSPQKLALLKERSELVARHLRLSTQKINVLAKIETITALLEFFENKCKEENKNKPWWAVSDLC